MVVDEKEVRLEAVKKSGLGLGLGFWKEVLGVLKLEMSLRKEEGFGEGKGEREDGSCSGCIGVGKGDRICWRVVWRMEFGGFEELEFETSGSDERREM